MEKARFQAAELEAAIREAEQRSHDCYVRADVPGGDAAQTELGALRPELESVRARLSAFEEAALVVAAERQRERQAAELERLTAAVNEAGDEARRQLAEVAPALSAAKLALRLAQQAAETANRLDAQRHVLDAEVNGRYTEANGARWLPQRVTRCGQVPAALERSPLLRALLADGAY